MPQSGSTDKVRMPQGGHHNQIPASHSQYQPNTIGALDYQTTALPKLVKTGYRFLWHLPGLPWDQPYMMRCPRRPIGPRPLWYYAPLQVDPLSRV
ncbi:hypothetical protein M9H77_26594 [Catharanthus roseus]|uniref:Uncharacterized protein n=1 Tax=Catharanthus roseus TaxID=4058 RepID=A0ACC0AB37_CATRO|nr:hypothetical protein M9H77_26594 [Catharanthus roseus]